MKSLIGATGPLRFLPLCILAGGLLLGDVERRDIGKPEADGKDRKDAKAEPELGKPGKRLNIDEHEKMHQDLAAEGEANLKEIARLMEKVRGNLSEKRTGDPTQTDQREIVKKIQELIDKLGKG
jgi:hypothetical protein